MPQSSFPLTALLQSSASTRYVPRWNGTSWVADGGPVSVVTTGAASIPLILSSRASQIQLDYPVTATLAPAGRRNWIQTDKDGAINLFFNTAFNDNNGDTNSANWTWTVFDATKPLADMCVDSNGDFNYYYAAAGATTLSIPSLVRMTGVNSGAPQLIISPVASTTNHAVAHLLVHHATMPRVLITDSASNAFTDANTLMELVRGGGSSYLRVRRSDNMASGGAGGTIAAMGSDDAGNTDKLIYLQVGRFAGFSSTMHGVLATNSPAGLLLSGDNAGAQIAILATTITIKDAVNFVFDSTTGTKIGTGTGQKIGFWNKTPAIQPTAIVDADGTLVDVTSKFNSLLTKLETIGILAI